MYNWQHKDWASFIYNEQFISHFALQFAELMGKAQGIFDTLNNSKQQVELIKLMSDEALKTSAIEGEKFSHDDLISSIRNRLGLNATPIPIKDKRAENIVLLMLQVRENPHKKLTEQMIRNWHQTLFNGSKYINAGVYRKGKESMEIVSGAVGKEIVHYEAPPSETVPQEMKRFVLWYNAFKTENNVHKTIIKTAITHLYFESIHPFEDGNGRIGRVLIEKCLSESLNRQIILCVSSVIDANKKAYYSELNRASKTLEIDKWLNYFAKLLIESQQNAINVISLSVKRALFFESYESFLNHRQVKVLNKMFDNGGEKFEGGMSSKKYISICKTTKATATRDLQELVKLSIFLHKGDGRSTQYVLNVFH